MLGMRLAALTLAVASSACLVRAKPPDTSIETTFPATAAARSLPRTLRVVTFNVHRETPRNVIRGIESDPKLREADLILLQEVHRIEPTTVPCSAACMLGKRLGYYTLYAPGHMQGGGSDGVAILSRAPILSGEVIELPDIKTNVNDGRRVALVATVLVDGTPVTVYGVHLTNRLTVKERKVQMRPVLEHAARQRTPVIMGGDVNTSPFTWVAGVLPIPIGTQDDHLEELVRSYGLDTPVADSGATSRFLGMKLDAIYTRGFSTRRFAVSDARSVSDHLALWAEVSLPVVAGSSQGVVWQPRSMCSLISSAPGA
ncbi:MAG: endonuclease/exonuclease/phosphatase family protein [Myxococcales bacterium]|nr:endonuclease/exonuclease/phosphatase family protein [Myxococcales bacterium]